MSELYDISIEEVQARLRMPAPVFRAVLKSGLLGFCNNGKVSESGVEHFEKFGTQWRPELGTRELPAAAFGAPIEGEAQPLSTVSQVRLSGDRNDITLSDSDTGWIAQFYLRPNPFFFLKPVAINPPHTLLP